MTFLRLLICLSIICGPVLSNSSRAAESSFASLGEIECQLDSDQPAPELCQTLAEYIKHDPKNGRAHFLAARAYEQAGYDQLAEEQFGEALKLDPLGTLLWQYRNRRLQQLPDADNYLHDMVSAHPNAAETHLAQALDAIYTGRSADADKLLAMARKESPTKYGLATLEAWRKIQSPHEALRTIEPDFRRNPNDPLLSAIRGQALLQIGQTKQAENCLNRAFTAYPDMKGLGRNLAQCYLDQGKPDEAIYPAMRDMAAATDLPELGRAKLMVKTLLTSVSPKVASDKVAYSSARLEGTTFGYRYHLALADVFDQLNQRNFAVEHYLLGLNGYGSHGKSFYRLAEDLENYYRAHEHALYFMSKAIQAEPTNGKYRVAHDRILDHLRYPSQDLAYRLKNAISAKPLHPWLKILTLPPIPGVATATKKKP